MRVGIFGGTFDPPHLGHLILAAEAYSQLHLDHLLWVLTPDPPHKRGQPISPGEQRLELVLAAIGDNPTFELSRVDLDRPGPHYTLDTVRLLKQQFAGDEIFYLIGGDSLHDLPNWHRPQELTAELEGWGVMHRPGEEVDLLSLEKVLPGITAKLFFVDAPLLEISSRQIRCRIASGRPYRYYLPQSVYDLIRLKHWYQQEIGADGPAD